MRQSAFPALLAVSLFAAANTAVADDAPKPPAPEWKFALHGFLGGSLFGQDGFLGPSGGQQPLWAVGAPKTDKFMLGGDIRQNRLNFSIAGPTVLGGTPRGVLEVDFFGGNSSGNFGDVSLFPRMRVSYAELGWTNTTLRVGQEYQLTAGINTLTGPATAGAMAFPTSVGHIAFPISFGAGSLGWRYPGIFLYQRVPMGDNKMEIAFAVMRSAWANPANPGVGTVAGTSDTNPFFTAGTDLGSASGLPTAEARITYAAGSVLGVTVTGHVGAMDPSNWGAGPTGVCGTAITVPKGAGAGCDTMTVYALNGDFRLNLSPIILQGGGYVGQNTSPMLGEIIQFNNPGAGNTSDWGAWGQLGFMFTKQLGLYVFAGVDHPDAATLRLGGQQNLLNVVTQGMLRWFDGGFAYGLEWTHWHTDTANPPGAIFPTGIVPVAETAIDVNQFMFSTYYFF